VPTISVVKRWWQPSAARSRGPMFCPPTATVIYSLPAGQGGQPSACASGSRNPLAAPAADRAPVDRSRTCIWLAVRRLAWYRGNRGRPPPNRDRNGERASCGTLEVIDEIFVLTSIRTSGGSPGASVPSPFRSRENSAELAELVGKGLVPENSSEKQDTQVSSGHGAR